MSRSWVCIAVGATVGFAVGCSENGGNAPSDGQLDAPVSPRCGDGVVVPGELCLQSSSALSTTTNEVQDLAVGDFNEDTLPDLVVANLDGGVVFIAIAPAQYGAGIAIPMVDAISVNVADFDNDGHQDLAVGRQSSTNQVTFLWGDGTGAFPNQVSVANPYTATVSASAIGDFNKDGRADVATSTNGNAQSLLLVRNDGGRSFTAASTPAFPMITTTAGNNVAVGDFNGDAHLDLLAGMTVGSTAGSTLVFMNDGAGAFASPIQVTPACNGNCVVAGVAAGKLNADTYDDIVLATSGASQQGVALELSSGANGIFSLPDRYDVGSNSFTPTIGDLDADGDRDIVVPVPQQDTVVILLGDDTGKFTAQPPLSVSPLGRGPRRIVIADLNKDGAVDLVTANGLTRNVSLFLANP